MKYIFADDNQADSFFFHYCSGEINMQIIYLLLKSISTSSLNLKLYSVYEGCDQSIVFILKGRFMSLINWKNECGIKNSENHLYKVKNYQGMNLWYMYEHWLISNEEFNVCFISEALSKYGKEGSLTTIFKFEFAE